MTTTETYLSPTFVEQIILAVRNGWGFIPFTGSGISAGSGILMGTQFDEYLGWMVYRCVHSSGHVPQRWDVRADGWITQPKPEDVEEMRKWVFDEYGKACERCKLELKQGEPHYVVGFAEKKEEKSKTALIKSHRPLLPRIINGGGKEVCDDDVIERLRSLPKEALHREALLQSIAERAIRSLHDWRATLEFLAALGTAPVDPMPRLETLPPPCIVERDSSVIDAFNLYITRGRKPNLTHTMLCHLAEPLRTRTILTTNFDALQEDAFVQLGEHYETVPVSIRGDLPSPDTVHSLNCILKLHGSLNETRADYSLDDEPTAADKDKFFHYVRGLYPVHRDPGQGKVALPKRFLPSHILVCGVSGNDFRCIQFMKYVLDRAPDARLFWICYANSDYEHLVTNFPLTDYKDKLCAIICDRPDLLLLDLYQRLTLRLPKGGASYQYSHDVPPVLWTQK